MTRNPKALEHHDLMSDDRYMRLQEAVSPYTMTSPERIYALYESVLYLHEKKIQGDIVECGVWKGGSMLLVAMLLKQLGDTSRTLWLYDTFDGMVGSCVEDHSVEGHRGISWATQGDADYIRIPLSEVMATMKLSGYPENKFRFVQGDVAETAETYKRESDQRIALLRLDTDFYLSTKVELEEMYPCVASGGIVIIDDYGYWAGSKKATDQYFKDKRIFLNRIDFTGRLIVKP